MARARGRFGRGVVALGVVTVLAGSCTAAAWSAGNTATLAVGDTFVAKGQTGELPGMARHAVGVVIVRGRWNGGSWRVLTTTRTDASGRYRFAIEPHRHGLLALRIVPPDRHIKRFVLHVV